jgi:ParB-like chromosome segregation protein Spo0J
MTITKTTAPDVMWFDPDMIKPNPYQPREAEDPAHICKIAESIFQDGLLQIPVGRTVGGYVELAFGHTRWRAVQLLNNIALLGLYNGYDLTGFPVLANFVADRVSNQLAEGALQHWKSFPVIIRNLSNEEMFRLAISENVSRKDLTPLEEARSMRRYQDDFGKTSVDIGRLFGLSDSAVRNKMRLLKLPEAVQNALRNRDLTEGQARALVPMYDLPDDVIAAAENSDALKPSDILEVALSGVAPAQIGILVAKFIKRIEGEKVSVGQYSIDSFIPQDPEETDADREIEAAIEAIPQVAPIASPIPAPIPAPKPTPVPVMAPTVSMETVGKKSEPERERESAQQQIDKAIQHIEKEIQKRQPQPQPEKLPDVVIPAPEPVIEKPAEAIISPAVDPVKPTVSMETAWDAATITLTLTYWPEDGNELGRPVMVGARINQGMPKMVMMRESQIELPEQLRNLTSILKNEFGG